VAPVLEVDEVVDDAQYTARRAFVTAKHPTRGTFRQVAAVWAGAVEVNDDADVRDAVVTDTDELLGSAGLSPTEINALRSEGVVA
jgi:crotonobetainyl-CoA:carnitine CoA-transferase CaiB-like acyl-CoA transferase